MKVSRRALQGAYLLALSAVAHLALPARTASAADTPATCYLCTNVQCIEQNHSQLAGFCNTLCQGSAMSFQCIGGSCEGQGGGSYSARLECLRDL